MKVCTASIFSVWITACPRNNTLCKQNAFDGTSKEDAQILEVTGTSSSEQNLLVTQEENLCFTLEEQHAIRKSNHEFGCRCFAPNHLSEDIELSKKTTYILKHQKDCHEEDGAGSNRGPFLFIRAIQGHSEARIQPNFSSQQSSSQAMRKNSTISVTRSTRKPSKNKVSWQAASIKTKVDKLSTSRQPLGQKPEQEGHGLQTFSLTTRQSTLWTWKARRRRTSSSTKRSMAALSVSTRSPRSTSRKSSTPWTEQRLKPRFHQPTKVSGALTDRAHQPCLIAMESNQHCEVHRADYGTASSSSTTPMALKTKSILGRLLAK